MPETAPDPRADAPRADITGGLIAAGMVLPESAPAPTEELMAGRYRIERRLARGGQASVYLAYQVPLNRPVALKVLVPPPESTPQELKAFEERFLLEARTLASLDHPNIVVVHDYGEVGGGRYYIAMEYIEGERFSDVLRSRPLNPLRMLKLVYQVCAALRYAHRRGVIHRDIKNSNVMIRKDENGEERVEVVDFGIVKLRGHDAHITQVGAILGSPHFMAPEQAKGEAINHQADIYSVGVLLYCALVGRYPFNGSNSTAILTAHLTQDVPPFDTVDPTLGLPRELENIVRKCLAKQPFERFADVDALMEALKPYVDGTLPLARPSGDARTGVEDVDDDTDTRADSRGTLAPLSAPANRQMSSTPLMAAVAVIAIIIAAIAVGSRGEEPKAGEAEASALTVTPEGSATPPPAPPPADATSAEAKAPEAPPAVPVAPPPAEVAPVKEPPAKPAAAAKPPPARTPPPKPPAAAKAVEPPKETTATPSSTAAETPKKSTTELGSKTSDLKDPWEN